VPGRPRSLLAGSRLIAPGIANDQALLTADGSTVLTVAVSRDGSARLAKLVPGSGLLRRSFPLAGPAWQRLPLACGVLWASPSGRRIFAQCGSVQRVITGSAQHRVRLALLLRAAIAGPTDTFAW